MECPYSSAQRHLHSELQTLSETFMGTSLYIKHHTVNVQCYTNVYSHIL
jgi:hypothetical protein